MPLTVRVTTTGIIAAPVVVLPTAQLGAAGHLGAAKSARLSNWTKPVKNSPESGLMFSKHECENGGVVIDRFAADRRIVESQLSGFFD